MEATIETAIITNSNLSKEHISTDIASDFASPDLHENYWKTLAERRGMALEEALAKNAILNQRIMFFEEETALTREMLNEARSLIEVLNDVIEGKIEMDDKDEKQDEKKESDTSKSDKSEDSVSSQ